MNPTPNLIVTNEFQFSLQSGNSCETNGWGPPTVFLPTINVLDSLGKYNEHRREQKRP